MRLCRFVIVVFALLWLVAAALLAIGTFGWFGQTPDPLSGVFLVPLGLPWTILGDRLGHAGPALGLLAPGVNLLILVALCRALRR